MYDGTLMGKGEMVCEPKGAVRTQADGLSTRPSANSIQAVLYVKCTVLAAQDACLPWKLFAETAWSAQSGQAVDFQLLLLQSRQSRAFKVRRR